MIRVYICTVVGAGTDDDPFRHVADDTFVAMGKRQDVDDGRPDERQATGWMVVWGDVTDAEHAALIVIPGVTWIPFVTAGGVPLGPNDTVGMIDPTRRTQIRSVLDARHIPTDDLVASDLIRKVVARILRRIRIKRVLGTDDWTEPLDTTEVRDIPAQRRNRISSKLQARGYDTSVILGTDTLRVAIRKLMLQNVRWNQNRWD